MDTTAIIMGNLTRDPELRYAPSGTASAKFGVAVNRKRGEEEQVSFFNVVCFGTVAENVAESLHKGDRVIVTGRLEQRSWEGDNGTRSTVELIADEVGPSLRWALVEVRRAERKRAEAEEVMF